jgi:hypothetical protein
MDKEDKINIFKSLLSLELEKRCSFTSSKACLVGCLSNINCGDLVIYSLLGTKKDFVDRELAMQFYSP